MLRFSTAYADQPDGLETVNAGWPVARDTGREMNDKQIRGKPMSAQLRETDRDRLIGIGLICLTLLSFAFLDSIAKLLSPTLPALQIIWARYAGNVLLVAVFINHRTYPGVLRTKKPKIQWIRSTLLLLSTSMNFIALRYLQLAETSAIAFTIPLWVALLSGPLLGETVGARRLAAIAIGFFGVLVITRPGLGMMHPAVLLSVFGTLCYALYAIATRHLAAYDSPQTTMVFSGLSGVVLLTPVLPFVWQTPQTVPEWAGLFGMGLFASFGHYCLILAHQRAPASILSPFTYTQLAWMIGLGYLLFGDLPDIWTLVGVSIVICSGLYLLSLERNRSAATSPSASPAGHD